MNRTFRLSGLVAATLIAGPALAQDSLRNASVVLEQSALTAALLAESGVKATVGVLAAPIAIAGIAAGGAGALSTAVGQGAEEAGEELLDGAKDAATFAAEPLKVDETVIVAAQPAPKVPRQAQPRR